MSGEDVSQIGGRSRVGAHQENRRGARQNDVPRSLTGQKLDGSCLFLVLMLIYGWA